MFSCENTQKDHRWAQCIPAKSRRMNIFNANAFNAKVFLKKRNEILGYFLKNYHFSVRLDTRENFK